MLSCDKAPAERLQGVSSKGTFLINTLQVMAPSIPKVGIPAAVSLKRRVSLKDA